MDTLVKKMNHILTHLHKVKYLSSTEANTAKSEYSSFITEMKGTYLNELNLFDQSQTRLDHFYFHVVGAEVKKRKSFK